MSFPSGANSIRGWRGVDFAARLDVVIPWILLTFAILYYSLYVRSGLNLGGEGGTAGVIALRLMDGQRPIADTFLGYNVLWFYPVSWLFEVTGPNYLALRWFFFAFCTASGLLTFFVVRNYTKSALYSAIPAIVVILIPGMLFRNYMPFLGVLNAFLLTRAFVMRDSTVGKMIQAGLGIGITFLFRVDLGLFFSVIFIGLCLLYPLGVAREFWNRSRVSLTGGAIGVAMMFLVHLPVWWDAQRRGFDREFVSQYSGWIGMVVTEWKTHWEAEVPLQPVESKQDVAALLPSPTPAATAGNPVTAAAPASTPPAAPDTWEDRGALARAPLADLWSEAKWPERSLAIITYGPIPISVVILITGLFFLIRAILRGDPDAKERALYPLTTLGSALTLFPQYFFFRPDTVHIAEMMVPFVACLAVCFWAAWQSFLKQTNTIRRALCIAACVVPAGFIGIYISHAMPKASAGTIAATKKASYSFQALNGVDVKVRKREARALAGLRDAVLNHSSTGEYVVCLPYSPTINFMTDRPSPLYNLYVDNATAGSGFSEDFRKLMLKSRPAVVVIDQRRINRSEGSIFKNWAQGSYSWLQENYVLVGRYMTNEVFVRPDKAPRSTTPEEIEVSD